MKKIIIVLIAAAAILSCAGKLEAQINSSNIVNQVTTNATQQTALDKAINALGFGITNYTVDPYLTYAPSVPKGGTKFGGGIMALYDFNQNAGAGLGLDWLGQFSLVSGDLQLKAPFHISTVFPVLASTSNPGWVQTIGNALITPFGLGGIGTSYSGNGKFNGSAMVISDVGGAIEFGNVLGGKLVTGFAWGKWTGQGTYGNVTRYHWFFGYEHGF